MKNKKIIIIVLVAAVILFAFQLAAADGCDGMRKNSGNGSYERAANDDFVDCESPYAENYAYDMEEAAYDDYYSPAEYNEVAAKADSGQSAPTVQDTSRKLIRTVNLSVETTDYDALSTQVQSRISQLGGYVESMDESADSYGKRLRNSSMTIRIPKERADELIERVEVSANVVQRSENVQDVTLSYVDIVSHKKSLEAEIERLDELMKQATSVEDLITIEDRTAEVRYRLESMESQLRTYDNQIDYTTIYLTITEVEKITPPQPKGYWEKIGDGFAKSFEGALSGLVNAFADIIIVIPYLIMWIIVVFAVVGIIRLFWGRRAAKKEETKNTDKE